MYLRLVASKRVFEDWGTSCGIDEAIPRSPRIKLKRLDDRCIDSPYASVEKTELNVQGRVQRIFADKNSPQLKNFFAASKLRAQMPPTGSPPMTYVIGLVIPEVSREAVIY